MLLPLQKINHARFFNFCKNYCQNAQRKGKWYFFPIILESVFTLKDQQILNSFLYAFLLCWPSLIRLSSIQHCPVGLTGAQDFGSVIRLDFVRASALMFCASFFFFKVFFCPLLSILLANLSNLLEMPLNADPLLNSQMTERDQSEIIPDEEKCLLLKFCVVVCSWLCDVLTSTTHVHSEKSGGNLICM